MIHSHNDKELWRHLYSMSLFGFLIVSLYWYYIPIKSPSIYLIPPPPPPQQKHWYKGGWLSDQESPLSVLPTEVQTGEYFCTSYFQLPTWVSLRFLTGYSVLLWCPLGTICLTPCLADMRRSKRQHSPEEKWVEDGYGSQRKEEAQTTKRPCRSSPAEEAELRDTGPRKNHHGKTYERWDTRTLLYTLSTETPGPRCTHLALRHRDPAVHT